MNKEIYERLDMDVTKFDVEDVITTSAINETDPMMSFNVSPWELPAGN